MDGFKADPVSTAAHVAPRLRRIFTASMELRGYRKTYINGKWYWKKTGEPSPIERWKNDADSIPFNPVPTDTIEAAAGGDIPKAALLIGRDVAVGQFFKYAGSVFQKMPDGSIRFADDAAGEACESAGRNISSKIRRQMQNNLLSAHLVLIIPEFPRRGEGAAD